MQKSTIQRAFEEGYVIIMEEAYRASAEEVARFVNPNGVRVPEGTCARCGFASHIQFCEPASFDEYLIRSTKQPALRAVVEHCLRELVLSEDSGVQKFGTPWKLLLTEAEKELR